MEQLYVGLIVKKPGKPPEEIVAEGYRRQPIAFHPFGDRKASNLNRIVFPEIDIEPQLVVGFRVYPSEASEEEFMYMKASVSGGMDYDEPSPGLWYGEGFRIWLAPGQMKIDSFMPFPPYFREALGFEEMEFVATASIKNPPPQLPSLTPEQIVYKPSIAIWFLVLFIVATFASIIVINLKLIDWKAIESSINWKP